MSTIRNFALIASVAAIAAACTTTEKVSVQQIGDKDLSCDAIQVETGKLDGIMEQAAKNKGVNGANVAAAVLFWPAIVGNYMNASDAEKLATERREHLYNIAEEKGCK